MNKTNKYIYLSFLSLIPVSFGKACMQKEPKEKVTEMLSQSLIQDSNNALIFG